MKTKKQSRFPDYNRVNLEDIVTFGTCLFLRHDKQALKIVFPAGQTVTFASVDEIASMKGRTLDTSR